MLGGSKLGDKFVTVKTYRKLRQEDIAADLGISRPKVSALEKHGQGATFEDDDVNIVPQSDGLWYAGRNMVAVKDLRKILQSGDTPYLVGVYDDGEKRVIQAALKAHRAKK